MSSMNLIKLSFHKRMKNKLCKDTRSVPHKGLPARNGFYGDKERIIFLIIKNLKMRYMYVQMYISTSNVFTCICGFIIYYICWNDHNTLGPFNFTSFIESELLYNPSLLPFIFTVFIVDVVLYDGAYVQTLLDYLLRHQYTEV